MVYTKTFHHLMGVQLKAYDCAIIQTRYNERFTHISCQFIGYLSSNGLPEHVWANR